MLFLFPVLALGAALRLLPPAAPAHATTVVSGHLTHPKGKTVAITYGLDPFTWQPLHRVQATLSAKGDFRVELPRLAAPTEAEFAHGQETSKMFLMPGNNLHLTVDPTRFDETMHYTGTGANVNNYLAQAYLRFDDDDKSGATPLATVSTDPPTRIQVRIAAFQHKRLLFLQAYAAAHPLPAVFRAHVRRQLAFAAADDLLTYPVMRAYMQVRQPKNEPLPANLTAPLPADYYVPLAALRPLQDSALAQGNSALISFLDSYAANQLAPGDSIPFGAGLYARANQQFGQGQVRDLAVAKCLTNLLSSHDAGPVAPLVAMFRQFNHDSAYAKAVRATFRASLNVSAGQPAPTFTVRNAAGRPVALADFQGKVVYLDFWASWCGPCLAEAPASTVLKKQFEGKDVVFLYLSIDENEAAWHKALAKYPLISPNSVHVLAKGSAFDGALPREYLVNAIPRYYLIGRDGRIITGHAPRPSAEAETVAALNAALAK